MARKLVAFTAVDFCDGEVRLAEITLDPDPKVVTTSIVSITDPVASLGIPRDANGVADHLRRALDQMSSPTRDFVFGLPPDAVTTRVMDIPVVPDSELRTVLQGEVEHFGVVRGFGGQFDHVRLTPGPNAKVNEPQALVSGSEAPQITALRDASERVRGQMVAIEPSLLGGLRVAASTTKGSGPHLLMAHGNGYTELALVKDRGLLFYRRIDPVAPVSDETMVAAFAGEAHADLPGFIRPNPSSSTTGALVTEIGRTLEYIKREFAFQATELTAALSNPSQLPLLEALQETLGLKTTLAKAPIADEAKAILFTNAYGLALRDNGIAGVPTFDLRPFDPVEQEIEQSRKSLATSLVASIVIIAVGIGAGLFLGMQANGVDHDVEHTQQQLTEITSVQMPQAMERMERLTEYRSLASDGLPVPQILDAITGTLAPRVGIESLEMNGTQVKLSGEAADEASMIQTIDRLRMRRGFTNVSLESFDAQTVEGQPKVIKFRLDATLSGAPVPTTLEARNEQG